MDMREAIKTWDKYRNLSEVERRQTRSAMYRMMGKVAKDYFQLMDRPIKRRVHTERVSMHKFRRTKWPAVDQTIADLLRAGAPYRINCTRRGRIIAGMEYVVAAKWLGWNSVVVNYVD